MEDNELRCLLDFYRYLNPIRSEVYVIQNTLAFLEAIFVKINTYDFTFILNILEVLGVLICSGIYLGKLGPYSLFRKLDKPCFFPYPIILKLGMANQEL